MKMTEQQIKSAETRYNAIPWNSAKEITPEAEALVQEHISKMREVIEHLVKEGRPALDVYADAQSAGYDAEGYDDFLEMLFKRVNYRPAPAKEPLILTIVSHTFWKEDPDMGHLEDPWAPLVKLYEMGYTSSFDQDDEHEKLNVLIGYAGGERSYPLL
jgi:hypothetical protein